MHEMLKVVRFFLVVVLFMGAGMAVGQNNGEKVKERDGVSVTIEGPNEICEGEQATLNAEVNGAVTDFVRVGDILCTDGSIVHYENWPCGKTAKAIVFYVDNTDQHGWAINKTQQNNIRWSASYNDIGTLPNKTHWKQAIRDLDGYGNTQKIRAAGNSTQYPAAYSCNISQGWYLPSAGQLNLLYAETLVVNASLSKVGGTTIPTNSYSFYWSSTEWSYDEAIVLCTSDGHIDSHDKQETNYSYSGLSSNKPCVARAVINF